MSSLSYILQCKYDLLLTYACAWEKQRTTSLGTLECLACVQHDEYRLVYLDKVH